jgi:hypothetical protein
VLALHARGTIAVIVAHVEAHGMLAGHVARAIPVVATIRRAHASAAVGPFGATIQRGVAMGIPLTQGPGPAVARLGLEAALTRRDRSIVITAGDQGKRQSDARK